MDTALNPNQTSPRHVLLDRADEELAHAYEQLTSAGEENLHEKTPASLPGFCISWIA